MKLKQVFPVLAALAAIGSSVAAVGCKAEVQASASTPTPPPPTAKPSPTPDPPAPPPPAPPPPAMTGAQLQVPGEIEFDSGSATIKTTQGSKDTLAAALKILKDNPSITKVRIEGHTDNVGGDAANQALSEKRAQAVQKWLVDNGIDAKRISAVGCAAKDPLMPNTSAENRAHNRRTEFDVEEMNGKPADGLTAACAPNPARQHSN